MDVPIVGAVKLVETDQVQRKVLDSVEQTVEPGVIADCGDDAGAAVAGLDRDVAEYACYQRAALATQDDLVPVAAVGEHGVDRPSLISAGSGLVCLSGHGAAALKSKARCSTFLAGEGVIRRHPARLFTLVKSSRHLT